MTEAERAEEAAFAAWRNAASIDLHGPEARGSGGVIPAKWVRRVVIDHAEERVRIFSGLRILDTRLRGDLLLGNLTIPFPIFFKGCAIEGVVYAGGIKARTLGFEGCTLERGGDFRTAVLDGHLFMRGDVATATPLELRFFVANGPLVLRDMEVKGTIDFCGAQLRYDGLAASPLKDAAAGECVGLSRTSAISLLWGVKPGLDRPTGASSANYEKPAAMVTLRDMKVHSFRHDMRTRGLESWPEQGRLLLDGFTYERMDDCPLDTALEWLALQPEATPSALFALARARDRQGQVDQAENVRARIKRLEIDKYPKWRKRMAHLGYWAIDYGASPLNALGWALAPFGLFLAIVAGLGETGRMEPAVDATLLETCKLGTDAACTKITHGWSHAGSAGAKLMRYIPPDYPPFSPIRYTLESFVPPLDFDQRRYWQPASDWVGLILSFIALVGLFFGGLFVAALTGLLSPREK